MRYLLPVLLLLLSGNANSEESVKQILIDYYKEVEE